jgi:sugar phosphate isomerase/epimerase
MTKPKIGLSMLYCLNESFKFLLKHLTQVDVKHIELPDEGLHELNKRRVKKLKKIAKTCNLDFIVHAPWAGINIATPNAVLRRSVLKRLKKSIIFAGQLDCNLWVFHPGSRTALSYIYPEEDWQLNLESVRTLIKIGKREGVKIAIENTPEPFPSLLKSVDEFRTFYRDLNEDINMVLDIAHSNLNCQIQEFITQFSKRIVHIHVSDNDGVSDLHQGIGYGNIDWKKVAKLVKATNYNNLIIIESTEHVEESFQFLRGLFI